jgi:hypothetical protein
LFFRSQKEIAVQELATTDLVKVGTPVLTGLIGASLGALTRRWWETRVLQGIEHDSTFVACDWHGHFDQEGEDKEGNAWPRTNLVMKLKARWKRVSGTISYDKVTLECSGGFYQTRILTLHYWTKQPGRLQSGVFLFRLFGTATELEGHFAGYGPETEGLVHGSVSLQKMPPVVRA